MEGGEGGRRGEGGREERRGREGGEEREGGKEEREGIVIYEKWEMRKVIKLIIIGVVLTVRGVVGRDLVLKECGNEREEKGECPCWSLEEEEEEEVCTARTLLYEA